MVLKIVGGEIFPESKQEEDDPLQMGGDFTLSRLMSVYKVLLSKSFREAKKAYFLSSGRILLSHKSSNPYDRPSLHRILDAVAC